MLDALKSKAVVQVARGNGHTVVLSGELRLERSGKGPAVSRLTPMCVVAD